MRTTKAAIAITASRCSDNFMVRIPPIARRNAAGARGFRRRCSCGVVTGVTGGWAWRRYISFTMKPMHLAALIVAAMSYFTLSAMIAAPHMFGL